MDDNSLKIVEVDINEILPNRFQPRIRFDEDEILELSDSIKEHGVIQPILVRPIGDKFEIISGERRYKASVLAGKDTVPVIVKNLDDRESADLALTENVQRRNLTPIEEAISYKKRLDMGYITQEELAQKLGKSQSSIANKIRLLNLSDEVQDALLSSKISERHARSLLRLDSQREQNMMLDRIINERLTVRRTDEEIDKLKGNMSEEGKGEINMNNGSLNTGMSAPSFDIFAGDQTSSPIPQPQTTNIVAPAGYQFDANGVVAAAPAAPQQPVPGAMQVDANGVVPQTTNMAAPTGYQFDANGVVAAAPAAQQQPVPGAMQVDANGVVPQTANMAAPTGYQFDANGVVAAAPATQQQPVPGATQVDASGVVPQTTNMAAPAGYQFDANGVVAAAPAAPQPSTPTFDDVPAVGPGLPGYENLTIPTLSPIVESQQVLQPVPGAMQVDASGVVPQTTNIVAPATPQPEPAQTLPEPIIITDYSKQYDPVMPPKRDVYIPKVDLKQIIEMIRNCSDSIEANGYKVELEEYDLQDTYQVTFKIQK